MSQPIHSDRKLEPICARFRSNREYDMKTSISLKLASAAVLLAATAFAGGAFAQDAEGIVVYNAQHEGLGTEWAEGFTKDTGIKVTVRKGSDMQFANQIV